MQGSRARTQPPRPPSSGTFTKVFWEGGSASWTLCLQLVRPSWLRSASHLICHSMNSEAPARIGLVTLPVTGCYAVHDL